MQRFQHERSCVTFLCCDLVDDHPSRGTHAQTIRQSEIKRVGRVVTRKLSRRSPIDIYEHRSTHLQRWSGFCRCLCYPAIRFGFPRPPTYPLRALCDIRKCELDPACITHKTAQGYTSLLGVSALTSGWVGTAHISMTLAVSWMIYAYRDLWPLFTYSLKPLDSAEGFLVWVRLVLLTVGAIIIPLTRPRIYVPFDPLVRVFSFAMRSTDSVIMKTPLNEPSPEQTASILSRLFYFYATPVVIAATRKSHLTLDELPPLSDFYQVKNLERRGFTVSFRSKIITNLSY